MTDDERRAEIEAVAKTLAELDGEEPAASWRNYERQAGAALAALDRVRDARDDNEALLEATKREAACGRELAAAHARIAELEAARSPQGEDHESRLREQIAWTVERCNAAMGDGFQGTPNSAVAAVCDELERLRTINAELVEAYNTLLVGDARSPQDEDHET